MRNRNSVPWATTVGGGATPPSPLPSFVICNTYVLRLTPPRMECDSCWGQQEYNEVHSNLAWVITSTTLNSMRMAGNDGSARVPGTARILHVRCARPKCHGVPASMSGLLHPRCVERCPTQLPHIYCATVTLGATELTSPCSGTSDSHCPR